MKRKKKLLTLSNPLFLIPVVAVSITFGLLAQLPGFSDFAARAAGNFTVQYAPQSALPTATPLPTATARPTSTAQPTLAALATATNVADAFVAPATPTLLPSLTPLPTHTPDPTLTPNPTFTPLPSLTPIPDVDLAATIAASACAGAVQKCEVLDGSGNVVIVKLPDGTIEPPTATPVP